MATFEKICPSLVFNAPLRAFPWDFVTAVGLEANDAASRMSRACDDISIRFNTVRALDRQTDRQTDMVEQYRALHDARRKVNSLREVSC